MKASKNLRAGLLSLSAGNAAARAIGILAAPVLSRMYDPASFGQFSLLASLTLILAPLFSLRYPLAIPLPESAYEARKVRLLATLLLIFFVTLSLFGVAASVQFGLFSAFAANPEMIFFFPFAFLAYGFQDILLHWATRDSRYILIVLGQLTQSLFGAAIKFVYGVSISAASSAGLILGHIGGFVFSSVVMFLGLAIWRTDVTARPKEKITFLQVFSRYDECFKYLTPSHALMGASTQMPILFTYALYGEGVAGYLGLAMLTITAPVQIFARSIGMSLLSEVAKIKRTTGEETSGLVAGIVYRLLAVSALPALILFFLSPKLFAVVFGDEWTMAGEIASILAIYLPLQMAQVSISQLYTVFGGNKEQMFLNAARLASVCGAFLFGMLLDLDFLGTYLLLSLSTALLYVLNILIFFKVSKRTRPQKKHQEPDT